MFNGLQECLNGIWLDGQFVKKMWGMIVSSKSLQLFLSPFFALENCLQLLEQRVWFCWSQWHWSLMNVGRLLMEVGGIVLNVPMFLNMLFKYIIVSVWILLIFPHKTWRATLPIRIELGLSTLLHPQNFNRAKLNLDIMLPIADDLSLLPCHFLQAKFMVLAVLAADFLAVVDYFSGVVVWIGDGVLDTRWNLKAERLPLSHIWINEITRKLTVSK